MEYSIGLSTRARDGCPRFGEKAMLICWFVDRTKSAEKKSTRGRAAEPTYEENEGKHCSSSSRTWVEKKNACLCDLPSVSPWLLHSPLEPKG